MTPFVSHRAESPLYSVLRTYRLIRLDGRSIGDARFSPFMGCHHVHSPRLGTAVPRRIQNQPRASGNVTALLEDICNVLEANGHSIVL